MVKQGINVTSGWLIKAEEPVTLWKMPETLNIRSHTTNKE